jgi:DNA-binding NtrC family response regulator
MHGSTRFDLVAGDEARAGALKDDLEKQLGEAIVPCHPDALRGRLSRETPGLLVLAALLPEDVAPLRLLVQEARLQQWPVAFLIVEGEEVARQGACAGLDAHVARRLAWPADTARLAKLVRKLAPSGPGFVGTLEAPPLERLRRSLVSHTPSLLPLLERLALAADHDITVLLTGETGSGKSFLARLIHESSPRQGQPFVVVPCGAQPSHLIESAFFGHVRGAFTGADQTRVGKFAAAGKGTILLDDIDTLDLKQQAVLLRIIETGEYEPLGSNKTEVCQARILVTTNRNLDEAVRGGQLREDLYYRLNVMSFYLPPLRERVEDIAPLARALTARFSTKFRKQLVDISPEALAALVAFPWPGNIRQLENTIQQAVLHSSGPSFLPDHLPPDVRKHVAAVCRAGGNGHAKPSLLQNQGTFERSLIAATLEAHGHSRSRTARALGISRVTLYHKMKKHGLTADGAPCDTGS